MYPLCGSFIICQWLKSQSRCTRGLYSYLKSEHSIQATQRLSNHCVHIKESILEILLNRFDVSVRRCDLELRGKSITCPETCPREDKIEEEFLLVGI